MLIVSGTLKIEPDKRDELLAAAQSLMAATRQEKGCHSYTMVADPIDANVVCIFEQWEDDDCLAAHMTQNHMAAFGEKMGKIGGIQGVDLLKHVIASSGPLH